MNKINVIIQSKIILYLFIFFVINLFFYYSLYPLCRMKYHGRFSYCFLCNVFYAKWLIRDSPLIPDDPCLLCDRCFKACHYDKDGNKNGNFSAYHFPQL